MRVLWVLILAVALLVHAFYVTAEEAQEEYPTFEIEVIKERVAGTVGKPASVSVITRTEIERTGVQNLMDLLIREPGVWVSRQGNIGFGGNVSIRGFGGTPPTQVAVMLDGHPTQMGIMGHILPTSYILDNVKRVEVLRGPAGGIHGDMAIGGAISIVTRGPEDEPQKHGVSFTGGSFGTYGGQTWITGLTDTWGYRAQVGKFSTSGDNPFAKYDADNYSLAVDSSFRGGWDMKFRGQRLLYTTFDQREVADAYAAGRPANFIEQDYDRADYDLNFSRSSADRTTGIKIYRTEGEHRFQDGFHSEDFGQGIVLSQAAPVGKGRGHWGLSLRSAGGEIYSPVPLAREFSRSENAVYFALDHALGDKSDVSLGFRYTDPEDFESKFLPYVGLNHRLNERWSLFAGTRRGYRLPSFRELYLFGINNPDLQPESAWQFEIGGKKRLTGGGILEISAFRIKADGLVVERPRPEGVPGGPIQLTNAGQVTRYGFEAGGRWPINPSTAIYANFSHLRPGSIKEQTVGRKLALGIDREIGKWTLAGDLQYIDRLFDYDQTNTLVRVPSFTVVSVKAVTPVQGDGQLSVIVANLFNTSYRVDPAYPYPMQPRYFGLQYERKR